MMNTRKFVIVLIIVQILLIWAGFKLISAIMEIYHGVTSFPEITAANAVLLTTLQTRKYSMLHSYVTPQCHLQIGRFTQEWERIIKTLGTVKSFEPMEGDYPSRRDQAVSWRCKVRLDRGTVVVKWKLIYHQKKWLIDTINLQVESGQSETKHSVTPKSTGFAPAVVQFPPPEIPIQETEQVLLKRLNSDNDTEARWLLMCLYAQQGKWRDSYAMGLSLLAKTPHDVNVIVGLVYAQANMGQIGEALALIEPVIRSRRAKPIFENWEYSYLLRVHGDLLMAQYAVSKKQNLLSKAYTSYTEALRLNKENTLADIGLARIEIERRQVEAAERRLRNRLRQMRSDEAGEKRKRALISYYLGQIADIQGDRQRAERFYREAIHMHPQSFRSGGASRFSVR